MLRDLSYAAFDPRVVGVPHALHALRPIRAECVRRGRRQAAAVTAMRRDEADRAQMQQSAELMYQKAWAAAARAWIMCNNAAATGLAARRMSARNRCRVDAARADVQRIMNASRPGR